MGDDLVAPGQSKDHIYPHDQGLLLCYHDHVVHHTALNTYTRLAGLAHGRYFAPLMLQDKIFSKDGQLVFDHGEEKACSVT